MAPGVAGSHKPETRAGLEIPKQYMRFNQSQGVISLASILYFLGNGCGVPSAFAGRPLTVDDAEPVGVRQMEFETGVSYAKSANLNHCDLPFALTYGLFERAEIGLGFGAHYAEWDAETGQDDKVDGVGDLTVGTKIKWLSADRFWADQALALTLKPPTASYHKGFGSGEMDIDAAWILSKTLGKRWTAHGNVAYTWTGNRSNEAFDDVLRYGLALDYALTDRAQWVMEAFALTPLSKEDNTAIALNGGLRWKVSDSVVLDAALGTGARRDPVDIRATVGITWTFDFTPRASENLK